MPEGEKINFSVERGRVKNFFARSSFQKFGKKQENEETNKEMALKKTKKKI